MLKIALSDYFEFVKKNKILFFLVSVGLFAISFISLFLIDILREGFVLSSTGSALAYIYKEPVSSKEIYNELKKVGISSVGLIFVSEQAHLNEPSREQLFLKNGHVSAADTRVEFDKFGVVGYNDTIYNPRANEVYTGRYFNYLDKGKMMCIVHDSVVPLADNGVITALGYEFEIIGTTRLSGQILPYDHSSAIVTVETFAELDIPLKIIRLYFAVPPLEVHANKITEVLDSFGAHAKTEQPLVYFNIATVFTFITSFALYFFALGIIISMLILIFKCWISSQQSVFRIYSICGITDRKLLLMRMFQVTLFYIPNFIIASAVYIALTLLNYKAFVYTLIPHTFIINFFAILVILFIMTGIQNKKNSGFEALREI